MIHIYTQPGQPATRYRDPFLKRWRTMPGRTLVRTFCCGKLRIAANCTTKVYYDAQPFFCRTGMGCAIPRTRRRVTNHTLAKEFQRGLSLVGLARKHGLTTRRVEDRLRACR